MIFFILSRNLFFLHRALQFNIGANTLFAFFIIGSSRALEFIQKVLESENKLRAYCQRLNWNQGVIVSWPIKLNKQYPTLPMIYWYFISYNLHIVWGNNYVTVFTPLFSIYLALCLSVITPPLADKTRWEISTHRKTTELKYDKT